MAYVVTESCINCKHGTCVNVCPVDAFREGANFLVIDPQDCIDCHLCVPECPVNAIYAMDSVPEEQRDFIAINAALAKIWPEIIECEHPLPDAGHWENVSDKRRFLVLPETLSLEHEPVNPALA